MKPIVGIIILSLNIISCDLQVENDENTDTFTVLDDVGQAAPSNELVTIENQFAEKVAIELWLGEALEYKLSDGKVYAVDLKKLTSTPVLIEAQSSTSINLSDSNDVLAVVGVRTSDAGITPEIYEYIAQSRLFNIINGSSIRLSKSATLTAFSASQCLQNLSTQDINDTLTITNTLINISQSVASRWKPLKDITNPINTVLNLAKAIIDEDQNLQLQFLTDLTQWSVEEGTFTHTETVDGTPLTVTTQFLWGGIGGHDNEEVITDSLHTPENYVTNLNASIDNLDIVFTYDSTGPLAPLLGLPVDSTPGSSTQNIVSWVNDIVEIYQNLSWAVDIHVAHDTGGNQIDAVLSYTGRPSFNIDLGGNITSPKIDISQNPFSLTLNDAAIGSNATRSQVINIDAWEIKVFPDDSGAKGVMEFFITGDQNFDFDGSIAFNSDSQTEANTFYKCSSDNSPIVFSN